MGKRKKNKDVNYPLPIQEEICSLCNRVIPLDHLDKHHLIPKSKGGVEVVKIHRACHRQIHMLLTENELAKHFNTVEKILLHPDMQNFVQWIKDKPIDFLPPMRQSSRIKK